MFIKNREAVIRAIEDKLGARPCPLCGRLAGFAATVEEFQIIGFYRNMDGLDLSPKGEHAYEPCVGLICKHCGNIQMLSLRVLLDNPCYVGDSLR